uniref:Uncharacterized protein n=1 Tax=Pristionchus pacificus TaxID=54126 RepID=A0A2A6C7G9_PRIPA|eukprot:PDM74050.1 hypothetical protein PRIPAC_41406 [Pristionchus pacificus]
MRGLSLNAHDVCPSTADPIFIKLVGVEQRFKSLTSQRSIVGQTALENSTDAKTSENKTTKASME